jgi:acyl-CoA reductase-like NAD-dependent aldehyde dehydrogenase
MGDPLDEKTDLGPMIDEKAVERTQAWVDEAAKAARRCSAAASARGGSSRPRCSPT